MGGIGLGGAGQIPDDVCHAVRRRFVFTAAARQALDSSAFISAVAVRFAARGFLLGRRYFAVLWVDWAGLLADGQGRAQQSVADEYRHYPVFNWRRGAADAGVYLNLAARQFLVARPGPVAI